LDGGEFAIVDAPWIQDPKLAARSFGAVSAVDDDYVTDDGERGVRVPTARQRDLIPGESDRLASTDSALTSTKSCSPARVAKRSNEACAETSRTSQPSCISARVATSIWARSRFSPHR
jgi:hypothetical protein